MPTHVVVDSLPGASWWAVLLQVLATLGALIPAGLFLVERRDRESAETEARTLREAAAKADQAFQARRVHIWVQDMGSERLAHGKKGPWVVRMVNTSGAPVFNVHATVSIGVTGGSNPTLMDYENDFILPTAPGEILEADINKRDEVQGLIPIAGDWTQLSATIPTVTFTDAEGRQWRRNQDGRLDLLDTPEPAR